MQKIFLAGHFRCDAIYITLELPCFPKIVPVRNMGYSHSKACCMCTNRSTNAYAWPVGLHKRVPGLCFNAFIILVLVHHAATVVSAAMLMVLLVVQSPAGPDAVFRVHRRLLRRPTRTSAAASTGKVQRTGENRSSVKPTAINASSLSTRGPHG